MAQKRSQTYVCPACGAEKTLEAADGVSTKRFLDSLLNTIQCTNGHCKEWMAKIEEVQAAG